MFVHVSIGMSVSMAHIIALVSVIRIVSIYGRSLNAVATMVMLQTEIQMRSLLR